MRAVVFHEHGPIENLRVETLPDPAPGPGECLLRVRAVTLNGFDPMVMRGIPGLKTPLPMIPGADIAGEIVALGDGVDQARLSVGQRVGVQPNRPNGMMGETLRGGLCEYLATEADYLVPIPDAVGFEAAACLPTAYATAYRMLHARGRIQAGEKVLILGASGGVGTCCVQLAKAAGCVVAAVTSSADKAERLREIGADHVVDGSETDFVAWAIETFGKPRVHGPTGGVDVCVNYSGGDSWARSFRTVRRGGRILVCGATGGYDPKTDLRYIWSLEQTIIGSNGWEREDHVRMLDLLAEGAVVPVIDRVVPMTEIVPAMRDLQDRKVFGKVVLTP
ncbi:MAG: zinc-binding dehydrogenase [Azospirillaceae bacterium]